ncbi:MAG: HAMP domain-containing histidine kinase [Lachnospiraceae bacterium]|nr:HAMP domain-containing histidine kinase [Lachnospiraceae bacterium]
MKKDTRTKLQTISTKLEEITRTDSDERIHIFTDQKELMELSAQINALLEKHQKIKVDYRRSLMASKKMLSNISHDIKTPMTVLLGYLELMRLQGASDEMLQKAELKANQVMELIDQFFTLSKLESNDTDIELSKVNLSEICRESILDFYEILTNDHFQVEIKVPEMPVYVMGNTEALQRIFSNLISNAIRYGADGAYLGLFLIIEEEKVIVKVVDHGKGIEKAFADSVFERLFTMEDSRSRKVQGNGLGLTIAKNLTEKLQGSLTLESTPGVITTFTLQFPKIIS